MFTSLNWDLSLFGSLDRQQNNDKERDDPHMKKNHSPGFDSSDSTDTRCLYNNSPCQVYLFLTSSG